MSLLTRISLIAALVVLTAPVSARAQDSSAPKDTSAQKPDSVTPTVQADQEALTGFYEIVPGRGLTITLDKGPLYGAPSSGEKRKLILKSGTAYSVDGTSMTLTFILGADGRASDLIMQQNGQQRMLRKVP